MDFYKHEAVFWMNEALKALETFKDDTIASVSQWSSAVTPRETEATTSPATETLDAMAEYNLTVQAAQPDKADVESFFIIYLLAAYFLGTLGIALVIGCTADSSFWGKIWGMLVAVLIFWHFIF